MFTQLKQYGLAQARRRLSDLARRALAQPRLATFAQKLIIDKKYRINIGHPDRVVILMVGAGGTGSHAAHILAQLAGWAKTAGIDLRLYFIDPDVVEEKNLVRQNFCPSELGAPKALTLAWRFNAAFGLNIIPVVKRFSAQMLRDYAPTHSPNGTLTIVVGAVDNVCARREIAEAVTARLTGQLGFFSKNDRLFWLDAGNERVSGQVIIGNSLEPEPLLSPLGFCVGLPLPHLQEPTLLMDRPRPPGAGEDNLSCAELSTLDEQSAMINRLMATWLGVYLYRLLQSRDLDMMATFTSLTGTTRSTYITTGRLVLPKPVAPTTPVLQPPEDEDEDTACPNCGHEIIEGQDEIYGLLVPIRFCAHCHWREEYCPACGIDQVVEEEIESETGEIALGLACSMCGWEEPYPPEHQPAGQRELVE